MLTYADLKPGDIWWSHSDDGTFDSAWLVISISPHSPPHALHDTRVVMLLMWTIEQDVNTLSAMDVYLTGIIGDPTIIRDGHEVKKGRWQ